MSNKQVIAFVEKVLFFCFRIESIKRLCPADNAVFVNGNFQPLWFVFVQKLIESGDTFGLGIIDRFVVRNLFFPIFRISGSGIVIQFVNIGKVFLALNKINCFDAGKHKQYPGRYRNATYTKGRKIFYGLKQGGIDGGAIALFEFE